MIDRELIDLKIEMEFGVAPQSDTLPPAANNDEAQPRVLVSRFGDVFLTYFRHDLPTDVRAELAALDPLRAYSDDTLVREILARHAPCERVVRIRWYVFERTPSPNEHPDVVERDGAYVILVEGVRAARAWTTAANDRVVEVEVETEPAFRRRGYARQVVSAWAVSALASGRIAYYSHTLENTASAAVARSLDLRLLSDEVEYL